MDRLVKRRITWSSVALLFAVGGAIAASITGSTGGTGGGGPTGCPAPGIANNVFPCAASTGVPASEVPLLTAYTGPSTILTCQTIDHKIITGGLDVEATGLTTALKASFPTGFHPIYGSGTAGQTAAQAATSSGGACVRFTNDKFLPAAGCGTGCAGIDTGYADGATGGNQCYVDNFRDGVAAHRTGCGPVYVANTEIGLPQIASTGQIVAAGFTNYNVHAYNVYIHGGTTGGQCEGACEVYDSYLTADRGNSVTHMDGFITGGNSPGCCGNEPIVLQHNTLSCGSTTATVDCTGPTGTFGDFSIVSNVSYNNNYYVNVNNDGNVCNSHAGSQSTAKPYPVNVVFYVNGVYDTNCRQGVITYWYNGVGAKWCNNLDTTGVPIASSGFPPPSPDQC